MSTPTQTSHPKRATFRTVVAVVIALVSLVPYLVADLNIPPTGWIAQVIGVSAAITRILAIPQVEQFLEDNFSLLAAKPAEPAPADEPAIVDDEPWPVDVPEEEL